MVEELFLDSGMLEAAWQQASLKIASGGLGLRSAARHSSAAYVASVSSTAASCQQLDANYRVDLAHAVQVFNACVPAGRALPPCPQPVRQQALSAALDEAASAALLANAADESAHAHLRLLQQPGAGSWLLARPIEAQPHIFRVLLRLLPLRATAPCAMASWTGLATTRGSAHATISTQLLSVQSRASILCPW